MAVDVSGGILKQSDVRETVTNTEETSVLWNLDYARFERSFAIANVTDMYISPDGLELYVCTTGDDVIQYTMSIRWDISTATLTHTLDVSAKETDLEGLFFKPDGTKMYTTGYNGDSIDEYNLGTPWDLSTAVYAQEFDISGEEGTVQGLWIREDGKQVYISGTGSDKIQMYNLSTPWDITTAVVMDDVAFVDPIGIFFSRDGSKVFVAKSATQIIVWAMTSVFRISTAAADNTFTVFPSGEPPLSVFFNTIGSKMFIVTPTQIHQYSIKRGWI